MGGIQVCLELSGFHTTPWVTALNPCDGPTAWVPPFTMRKRSPSREMAPPWPQSHCGRSWDADPDLLTVSQSAANRIESTPCGEPSPSSREQQLLNRHGARMIALTRGCTAVGLILSPEDGIVQRRKLRLSEGG